MTEKLKPRIIMEIKNNTAVFVYKDGLGNTIEHRRISKNSPEGFNIDDLLGIWHQMKIDGLHTSSETLQYHNYDLEQRVLEAKRSKQLAIKRKFSN